MKRHLKSCAFVLACVCAAIPAAAQPVPDISVNGGRGQVIVLPSMAADLRLGMSAGARAGMPADWWLAAAMGTGFYTYSFTQGWTASLVPSYQGPLFDFADAPIVQLGGLARGTTTLFFAVDGLANGVVDPDLQFSGVSVHVPAWTCPAGTADSLAALSTTQQAFVGSRGNPLMFTLNFLAEGIAGNGLLVPMPSVRRIETWVYDRSGLVSDYFDNGHFVAEASHGGSGYTWPATTLSPAQFTACMSRAEVVALMGEPSCTLTGSYGGRAYQYLRYKPTPTRTASTVVLENGVLVMVMAGYSFVMPTISGTDLCATQTLSSTQ